VTVSHLAQPSPTRGTALLVAFLSALALAQPAHGQGPVGQPEKAGTQMAPPQSSRDKLIALADTSEELVHKLRTNEVEAANFRIQLALYRESLRDLMLADQKAPAPDQLPRPVLMEAVRMAALLQSAANCETGRYLVCPADLMERLVLQQKTLTSNLNLWTHSN
jgi:hypothetical protein